VSHLYKPTSTVGANDGINLNMYQWFIRQVNTATAAPLASNSELEEEVAGAVSQVSVIATPNPFTSDVSAQISLTRPQRLVVDLTDITGRRIKSYTGNYNVGFAELKLGVSDLPGGIYFLKVAGEDFSKTIKLIKK
jgi:hypothetical protein